MSVLICPSRKQAVYSPSKITLAFHPWVQTMKRQIWCDWRRRHDMYVGSNCDSLTGPWKPCGDGRSKVIMHVGWTADLWHNSRASECYVWCSGYPPALPWFQITSVNQMLLSARPSDYSTWLLPVYLLVESKQGKKTSTKIWNRVSIQYWLWTLPIYVIWYMFQVASSTFHRSVTSR